jgi:outer membrane protein
MKKAILLVLLALMAAMPTMAQNDLKFGYLSYATALQAMPEYAAMQNSMAELRQKYEAEQKRVEDDFNKKYEEFLDGQKSYPKTILQKRQSELQEMLDKNIAFKKESQRLLSQAEEEAMAPIRVRLAEVLDAIGRERGYAFIVNTDEKAALWLNPAMGEDVSAAVKALLQRDENER